MVSCGRWGRIGPLKTLGQVLTSVEPEDERKKWREFFGLLGLSSGSRSPQAVDSNPITDIFTCDLCQRTQVNVPRPTPPKPNMDGLMAGF